MKQIFLNVEKNPWVVLGFIVVLVAIIMPSSLLLSVPLFGMALGKNRDSFNVKGGGLLKSAVLVSGGALTTMDDLGYLAETNIIVDGKQVELDDERGFTINVLSGGEQFSIKSVLMQSSIDEYNLLKNGINEYRHFYYYVKLANGRFQELYIPLGKIIPQLNLSFKAGEKRNIPIEIIALMPKGAVTVTPAGLSTTVDTYATFLEGAAAVGQVTTTSGTIWSASV